MIKCSNVLLSKITILFNLILDSDYYPQTWNLRLIHSICKNSSKKDPSYCFVQLLSSLAYNGIENDTQRKDTLSSSQSGFTKRLQN